MRGFRPGKENPNAYDRKQARMFRMKPADHQHRTQTAGQQMQYGYDCSSSAASIANHWHSTKDMWKRR
jgi:hypothetical protein